MQEKDSIIVKQGTQLGPTLAVFCGVHGNETAGILAVKRAIDEIEIERGQATFIFANPRAIEQGIRFTEKNLNRCFTKEQAGNTYEEIRARELMPILGEVEALLDLHASNIPGSVPFIICEENAFPCAMNFDFDIISTGWDALEPGATDGYMFRQGKVGICAECGYAADGEKYAGLAFDTIKKFLAYYQAIPGKETLQTRSMKHLHVDRVIMKTREDFSLVKSFEDFEELPAGYCFARDGEQEYVTEKDSVIMFANPGKEVGGEACILGYWK